MSAKEILDSVRDETFENEDGDTYKIEIRSGLSAEELHEFENRFPKPLPDNIRELLTFSRGFEFGPVDEVDFAGNLAFAYEPAFPYGVPVAPDGFGNFWVIDVNPASGEWGPVFYASHDPPVIVYQAANLEDFLTELLKLDRPREKGERNPIDAVHEELSMQIWRDNPELLSLDQARLSDDDALKAFAEELDDRFDICDLRNAEIGDGFSWGRAGPEADLRRCGDALIFAVEKKKKGFLQRLFSGR